MDFMGKNSLAHLVEKIYGVFAQIEHSHSKSDIRDLPEIPTKVSDLVNDSGFKTTDNNTTYTLTKDGETIVLTGSDGSAMSVEDSDTKITVDSELSASSTNPVQNKVVYDLVVAIDSSKADADHNHDAAYDAKGTAATKASAVQENLDITNDKVDDHIDDAVVHITATERTNWNSAKTHASSTHARTDATKVADSTTNGNILVNGSEVNVYSHPNSGATAGTYKSVTVNAQGHVTAGTNPTTLAGYGITDAESKGAANSALASAKEYTDSVASTKANATHSHVISDVTDLQSTIDTINTEIDGSIRSLSVDGKVITYTKNDGTTGTITTQDTNTDTKVKQTVITTNGSFPILLRGTSAGTTTTTTTASFGTGITANPSTSTLTATTFVGSLSGNATSAETADTAAYATKATQDAEGNVITSTYETKTDASSKLAEAKEYADSAAATAANDVKNDLLNGAGAAYDTLKELGDLINENTTAIDALEDVAAGKQDKITGAATTVTSSNLTASRVLVSSSSGKIAASSSISTTELGYLNNVTSNIQTQLNNRLQMSGGTSLKSGDDLNNFKTFGNYVSSAASVSQEILNTPHTSTGFKLTVLEGYTDVKVEQFITTNSNDIYYRLFTNSSTGSPWTEWAHFYDMDDLVASITAQVDAKSDSGHTHTVSHTPAGTVSKPTFSGTKATISAKYTPAGSVSKPTFTGSAATSDAPSGTSTVASSTHTHKYTPSGTVSKPSFTGEAVTSGANSGSAVSVYSITAVGTLPTLTTSVANKCLSFTFNQGTLPTKGSAQSVAPSGHTHSVTAKGSVSQPTFTGTEVSTTSISGTTSVASSGHTHSVTATGSVSQPTFTGAEGTVSASYTPAGSVSQPTFTGTAATLTTSADS